MSQQEHFNHYGPTLYMTNGSSRPYSQSVGVRCKLEDVKLISGSSERFGVSVMFDTSCNARDDPRLKEYSMMFPNKLNPQEFLLCAYEEMLICPFVLEYATPAINLSLLQHSHLKLDTLDRKEQIFLRENQTHTHQSPLNPQDRANTISLNSPDRATTISRLITQSIVRSRERC